MTRKEIIDGLQFTVDMFLFDFMTGETFTEPKSDMDKITIDACKGAIKLLEQEPILDKIRTEIAEIQLIGYATVDGKREIASRAVLQIIDKYKVESEDKE